MIENILRLPRTDSEREFVLVNVSSNGPSPLDLKLLATEGENPFMTTVKQSRISKLRDKRNQLSDPQWENLLVSSLIGRHNTELVPLEKLEVVASIAGGQLAIVFRNNISGITQKLGEIILNEDDKQELDIISWAGIAVQRSNELEDEVRELTSKYYEQSKMLESLNKQLDDLVQAKKRHEDTLLEKFRELLNTKKLKIRDQQRLLAGAKVDPKQAAKIESARSASRSHTPVASRASKRKAKAAASTSSSSDESSFQKKATKQKNESDNSGNMNTPDGSDQDVTEDESDEYLKAAPSQSTLPESNNCEIGGGKEEQMALDTPPPIRKLPFERSGIGRGKEQMKQPEAEDRSTMNQEAGNEDEETDDDEL